jgi:hypothetical protein
MSYAIPPLQSLKKEKIFHMLVALLLYGVVAGCAATDVHTGVYEVRSCYMRVGAQEQLG